MFRTLLICYCALLTLSARAQQGFIFKSEYLPNQHYHAIAKDITEVTLDIKGDKTDVAQLLPAHAALPLTIKKSAVINADIKTGATKAPNAVPVGFTYNSVNFNTTINGISETTTTSMVNGETITGTSYAGGKLKLDSPTGNSEEQKTQNIMFLMLGMLRDKVEFPAPPLKIGDAFMQRGSVKVLLAGVQVSFRVNITYQLHSTSNGIASFIINEQTDPSGLDPADEANAGLSATCKGNGTGIMEFNIAKHYITAMQSNLLITFNVKTDKVTMPGTAKVTIAHHTVIAAN